jgi:predicted nuclease with RNAse H fold
MRAAGILSRLAAEGRPVDRAGNGIVVEVYPAASLRCWGLPFRGDKGGKRRAAREALIGALLERTPWLDLRAYVDLWAASDDALDAVIAALTSRAAALSKRVPPMKHTCCNKRVVRDGSCYGSTTRITRGALPRRSRRVLRVAWSSMVGRRPRRDGVTEP